LPNHKKGNEALDNDYGRHRMYIGIGTIVLILIIVLLIAFVF
jgi:hypothetical protein